MYCLCCALLCGERFLIDPGCVSLEGVLSVRNVRKKTGALRNSCLVNWPWKREELFEVLSYS